MLEVKGHGLHSMMTVRFLIPLGHDHLGPSYHSEHWQRVCWAAAGFTVLSGSTYTWNAGDVARRDQDFSLRKFS